MKKKPKENKARRIEFEEHEKPQKKKSNCP